MDHPMLRLGSGPADPHSGVSVDVRDVNHLPILAGIWDEMDLTARVNHIVGTDPQMAVTPGLMVKTLVLDVLAARCPV